MFDLIGKGLISESSRDIGLLMAFVSEGGMLSDLVADADSETDGLDVPGLADILLSVPPQRLIACSGLAPCRQTSKMFCQLVRQMLQCHNEEFVEILSDEQPAHEARMNFLSLSALARIARLPDYQLPPTRSRLSAASLESLTGSAIGTGHDQYPAMLRKASHNQDSPEQFTQTLTHYFLQGAFCKAINTHDTEALVDDLMIRARSLANHLGCPKDATQQFAEQLVATALFATPEHFNRARFGFDHLIGFPTLQEQQDPIRTVMDGPLAILMRTTEDPNHLAWILGYSKALHPDFSLNAMIDHRGFGHTRTLSYLDAQNGHVPAIEKYLVDQSINPNQILSLLHVIARHDCYDRYSPQALDAAMAYYLDQIPAKNETKWGGGSILDDIKINVREDFRRAFELNPDFKKLFVARLENTPGLTSKHLRLFTLDIPDVRTLAAKLPIRERGRLVEDQLGL